MSTRSIRSELKGSRYPLKLAMAPAPSWARRAPSPAPGPEPGDRVRRSELVDLDSVKRADRARKNSEPGEP